jgi:hypothetical protein
LNRSPGGLELSEPLFGIDPAFHGAMVLFDSLIANDKTDLLARSGLLEYLREGRSKLACSNS